MKNKRRLPAFLMVAAALLVSAAFTSSAIAQCVECDEYQNQDPSTQGLATTPAAPPRGAVSPHSPNNAHAEMPAHHGHHIENRVHRHK